MTALAATQQNLSIAHPVGEAKNCTAAMQSSRGLRGGCRAAAGTELRGTGLAVARPPPYHVAQASGIGARGGLLAKLGRRRTTAGAATSKKFPPAARIRRNPPS